MVPRSSSAIGSLLVRVASLMVWAVLGAGMFCLPMKVFDAPWPSKVIRIIPPSLTRSNLILADWLHMGDCFDDFLLSRIFGVVGIVEETIRDGL